MNFYVNKAKIPTFYASWSLTINMRRNEPWPGKEMVRVTGNTPLRGAHGRGDERQICRYKKRKT